MKTTWIKRLLLFSLLIVHNPTFGQLFEKVEHLAGLDFFAQNNGVAIADYDGDLDLDFFVVAIAKDVENNELTHSKLYRNNNDGTFTDVTQESGLVNLFPLEGNEEELDDFRALAGHKYGAFWGDYDNDGRPDILFTHRKKIQLFRNQGSGRFSEVTNEAGFQSVNDCENTSAIWFDYNNDSFLDIYIPTWKSCSFNIMYRNNGDGTFTDVSDLINIVENEELPSFNPFPYDFNQDGYMDLYLTNDLRKANQLFINNSGNSFTEQAISYGVDTKADDMGIAVSDYNNDGHFDFFITAIQRNFLLTNDGDTTFTEDARDKAVGDSGWAWGTKFGDFDLDGDEDLFVVNGYDFPGWGAGTNIYYENNHAQGENDFTIQPVGLEDFAISVEAVDFDYDNDGDLDLIVTNSDRNSHLYRNNTLGSNENPEFQWLKISLVGTISNRNAIGTTIELTTDQSVRKRYYTGVGFLGQNLKPVHFGIPSGEAVNSVKITWPSGIEETHQNIEANTHIRAIENNGFEVLDNNTASLIFGCTDPSSCNYNPNAIMDDGTCEYLSITNTIEGRQSTGFFAEEAYSLSLQSGQSIVWKVTGGEITSGQNTDTIEVEWSFESAGEVIAVISGPLCSSEEITLNVTLSASEISPDKSIARVWNEALLDAIRGDFARPTIHARNLFHTSAAMYDAWAILNNTKTYLIGNEVHGFRNQFAGFEPDSDNLEQNLNTVISHAAYRILSHRFRNSPSAQSTLAKFNLLMDQLGHDRSMVSVNYVTGNPAALGNFIAETYIDYGNQDGSREQTGYNNAHYEPINSPLAPILPGNPNITDPDRWQSLSLDTFIDQSGNLIEGETIDFLSPEWGNVSPFAMANDVVTTYTRNGNDYKVYNDPEAPPYINSSNPRLSEAYKWGFSLVSVWSAHLDPADGVLWDISPRSIGNLDIQSFPTDYSDYPNFYKLLEGGDIGQGYSTNPITGMAYDTQMAPRGDYARVLAEFWADGPDSETPPGHWFTLLNYVNDHPSLEKRLNGEGPLLSPLEWDIKTYFTLGGAMHDAAISAWSIKGWYDYVRPISAIRYMADQGQSSDPNLPSYNENGIPLLTNYIELVDVNDPLAGREGENIGKIKLFAWKGHRYIGDTDTDTAGVDWILADEWWPYQRPSFVTPPFAGYVSGHSTYSRAAAEVLTLLTGSQYFPGGLGEFVAKQNEFLVFEEGPSVDIKLQWASYRDASDQCSLSRIWGGIHPPADDIPGRLVGEKIGIDAFNFAASYFEVDLPPAPPESTNHIIYPIPNDTGELYVANTKEGDKFYLFDLNGSQIAIKNVEYNENNRTSRLSLSDFISTGMYLLRINNSKARRILVKSR
ncbi:FG-GAP-like repeat-containing protein [Muricauda sp. SCSIO 64092]|uniref:FG-GAP-like repeat-containing protein n=1 Tax=Allomuricauda sp. SCSIO 64092 TaxID=2908842 RepID=UPI001FF0EF46|nr:FG-GAP-like repeat-containing protein [Muricauda sp. SCSIO 64092]UOY05898.1 FG-GAP-like repeat-containing protein [Muricauda sp. SCSIO 64092]